MVYPRTGDTRKHRCERYQRALPAGRTLRRRPPRHLGRRERGVRAGRPCCAGRPVGLYQDYATAAPGIARKQIHRLRHQGHHRQRIHHHRRIHESGLRRSVRPYRYRFGAEPCRRGGYGAPHLPDDGVQGHRQRQGGSAENSPRVTSIRSIPPTSMAWSTARYSRTSTP